jgi:hypothetical protein
VVLTADERKWTQIKTGPPIKFDFNRS